MFLTFPWTPKSSQWGKKATFSKGNDGALTYSPLYASSPPVPTLAPYLTCYSLNPIHRHAIGCPEHVTYIGPKKCRLFSIGVGFSHGSCLRSQRRVCERVGGRAGGGDDVPPSHLLSNIPLSLPLFFFFHHLPSFETQYHTLDGLCCHSKKHSFSGTATRSVRMPEVPWKTLKEQKKETTCRKCPKLDHQKKKKKVQLKSKVPFERFAVLFDLVESVILMPAN